MRRSGAGWRRRRRRRTVTGRVRDDALEMESGEQESVEQLAGVLRTFGVSEPAIARAIELGDSQAGIAEIIPARGAAARTVSAAQIATRRRAAEQTAELMHAFGLPAPDRRGARVHPGRGAGPRGAVEQLREVFPFELAIRPGAYTAGCWRASPMGRDPAVVAVVEPRLRAAAPEEHQRAARPRRSRSCCRSPRRCSPVHRWAGSSTRPPSRVRGAEREAGDEAEARRGRGRDPVLRPEGLHGLRRSERRRRRRREGRPVREPGGREHGPEARLTKWLGDGFMLVYPEARPAVAAGVRIIDAMRPSDRPGVHASVHSGYAVPREGDYFGRWSTSPRGCSARGARRASRHAPGSRALPGHHLAAGRNSLLARGRGAG